MVIQGLLLPSFKDWYDSHSPTSYSAGPGSHLGSKTGYPEVRRGLPSSFRQILREYLILNPNPARPTLHYHPTKQTYTVRDDINGDQ